MTTDDGLVARVREGDDVAFERLYGRYEGRVRGYVAGMVGDAGRSEDVTQEVFVSALRRLRSTDAPVAFKPWVFEIARNAAIDEFRRVRRRPETPVQHGGHDGRPGLEAMAGKGPSLQVAVETRETLGDLTAALGGLADIHRQVLVLRELEGRSYEEIAVRTGLTRAAVESALFRARRRLGTEYEELSSGRRCAAVRDLVTAGRRVRGRARETARHHLSDCHDCRRHAALAGVDLATFGVPATRDDRAAAALDARIADAAGRADRAAAALAERGRRPVGGRIAALLPLPALVWLRRVAETLTGTGDGGASWGKAAAATAVVLAAGGAGVIGHRDAADNVQRPAASPAVAAVDGARAATADAPRTGARVAAGIPRTELAAASGRSSSSRVASPAGGVQERPARVAPAGRPPASAPRPAAGPAAAPTAPSVPAEPEPEPAVADRSPAAPVPAAGQETAEAVRTPSGTSVTSLPDLPEAPPADAVRPLSATANLLRAEPDESQAATPTPTDRVVSTATAAADRTAAATTSAIDRAAAATAAAADDTAAADPPPAAADDSAGADRPPAAADDADRTSAPAADRASG